MRNQFDHRRAAWLKAHAALPFLCRSAACVARQGEFSDGFKPVGAFRQGGNCSLNENFAGLILYIPFLVLFFYKNDNNTVDGANMDSMTVKEASESWGVPLGGNH